MNRLTVAFVRDVMDSHFRDEISFSRMVELLNEEVNKSSDAGYKFKHKLKSPYDLSTNGGFNKNKK